LTGERDHGGYGGGDGETEIRRYVLSNHPFPIVYLGAAPRGTSNGGWVHARMGGYLLADGSGHSGNGTGGQRGAQCTGYRLRNERTCRSQTSSGDHEHTWRAAATSSPGEQPELSFEQRRSRASNGDHERVAAKAKSGKQGSASILPTLIC
jgi:hypothetical protein